MDNLLDVWEKYRLGDSLTDKEMIAIFTQVVQALPYVEARGTEYHLVRSDMYRIINDLEGYLRARKYNIKHTDNNVIISK